ncbi:hypothetical protein LIBA6276_00148 [Clostridioides phage LIBA6276]|nr:hypothetical protein LIBA6276_00148 [Clostridioides phage LIBA6276]VIF91514.1 Uncharacterised protein [Clostridioides difficile]
MICYIKDIHKISLYDAYRWSTMGLSFIIKDGKLKGFTI